jgi:hypothetical protein
VIEVLVGYDDVAVAAFAVDRARAAAVIGESIGIPSHLSLSPFDIGS